MKAATPWMLMVLAGAAIAGGCASKPTRTGSPIRDPNAPRDVRPGAPAVAADGEVYPGPGRPRPAETAVRPTPTPPPTANPTAAPAKPAQPSKPPAGREPAIDLAEGEPAKPEAPKPAKPVETPNPNKPAVPSRTPAIDLEETAPPEKKPEQPRPARPAPPPAANPEPTAPSAPVDVKSVQAMSERAIELVRALSRSDQPDVRANAAEASGLAPRELEAVIAAALLDRNEGVQAIAAMTVGRKRLVTLAPRVRPLLGSSSPYVEAAAIMALARNGEAVDDAKTSRLAELLFTHPSPRVRAHVAFVLGEVGNKSALPMLKDAASVKMPLASSAEVSSMLLQIAEAMVKLGDTDQIDTIRAALQPARPEDLELTAVAVQILGELGDRRPMDQLVYLSAYRDPTSKALFPAEVRMQVASSMAKLGRDQGGFIADEFWKDADPALRAQAAGVFGDTGRAEHLEKLAVLMDDPVEQVRISAASAVLKISNRARGGK